MKKDSDLLLIFDTKNITDIDSKNHYSKAWDCIASAKTHTITINNQVTHKMEYYYRRGNRYFLRGAIGKIIFDAEICKDQKLIRGKIYDITLT